MYTKLKRDMFDRVQRNILRLENVLIYEAIRNWLSFGTCRFHMSFHETLPVGDTNVLSSEWIDNMMLQT